LDSHLSVLSLCCTSYLSQNLSFYSDKVSEGDKSVQLNISPVLNNRLFLLDSKFSDFTLVLQKVVKPESFYLYSLCFYHVDVQKYMNVHVFCLSMVVTQTCRMETAGRRYGMLTVIVTRTWWTFSSSPGHPRKFRTPTDTLCSRTPLITRTTASSNSCSASHGPGPTDVNLNAGWNDEYFHAILAPTKSDIMIWCLALLSFMLTLLVLNTW